MASAGCPDSATLAALAAGLLSGDALAAVAAHLDDCPSCLAQAQAAGPETDPLVAAFCRPGPADPHAQEAGCGEAMARLQALAEKPTVLATATELHSANAAVPSSGRYRPMRFHARGGLGEVHLALDAELSRRVALKRIQRPCADDPESRRRFLQEAEITAQLEHPGVVPVYGLVQDDSGQPCYAMRFIQGETLESALTRFHRADTPQRDPGERRLALRDLLGRFVAACNTIAYAHSKGVLHRDLKPANIMLGAFGETLVVDWGLAKRGGSDAPEPTLGAAAAAQSDQHTRTGQALGTPAYMSPEQALGQANTVGTATDVYGLGATLYAILTGRPPLEGTTAEVLETVRQGKVPSPRALKKDVPRPLEAVCRKAMALRPEDRYTTALALAADIEHWLADEPVSVYRNTLPERMGRWARRHRATVIAAASVGLATLLGVSILAWQSEKGRRRLESEQMATDEARREAEANARRERQAIRDYFMRSAEDPAWKAVGLEPLRRKLLEEARTYLRGFLRTHGEDPELLAELAEAHARLGNILAKLGDREQACAELKAALELEERLAAIHPGEAKFRFHQSTNWNALGRYLGEMGRATEAQQALEYAVDLAQRLADDYPDELKYLERLSSAHSNLAELLKDLGNYPAARRSHERALELRERLVKLRPDVPGDQHNLALSCNDLGVLLRSQFGDQTGARQFYERAAYILKNLVEHHPMVPEYRWDLAMTHNNLGVLYEHLGDRRRARTAHERALELNRQLHAEHPSVVEYRRDLSMNHFNLGLFLRDERDLVGARREIEQAVALREPLVKLYPKVPEYRQDLARCHKSLGTVLDELGDFPRAEQAFEQALALQQELVEQNPRPQYRSALALAYNGLGRARGRRGDLAGRRQAHEKAVAISEQLVKEYPGVLPYAASLWESCYNMANVERENGRLSAAVDWSSRAIAALGGEFRDKLDVFARKYLRNSYRARALPLTSLGRHADAVKDWDEAIALDDGSARHALLLGRGLSLAQFGAHARAVIDAEEGVRSADPTAEDLFDAAYIYAVSASKVLRDIREEGAPPLTQSRRKELAQRYTDRAVALLTQSVQKDYKYVKRLKTDKVLEPLRGRDDFQKLLKKLEGKMSETVRPTPEPPGGSPK